MPHHSIVSVTAVTPLLVPFRQSHEQTGQESGEVEHECGLWCAAEHDSRHADCRRNMQEQSWQGSSMATAHIKPNQGYGGEL